MNVTLKANCKSSVESVKEIRWWEKKGNVDCVMPNEHDAFTEKKFDIFDENEIFSLYAKLANQGDVDAQYRLAVFYKNGYGVVENFEKAVYWYTKSAEQGNAYAQNSLGVCYYNGEGVTEDVEKAVYWYIKSAEQGHVYAQYNLATCYYFGYGVTSNSEEALHWYIESAKQGYADALHRLDIYRSNRGPIRVTGCSLMPCEQGHGRAMDSVVIFVEHGELSVYNLTHLLDWYAKSAEEGHACAQYNLAELFYSDKVDMFENRDIVDSLDETAIGQGFPRGRSKSFNFHFYYDGRPFRMLNVPVYLFTKAAEQGHACAQNSLAICYYNGDGVTKNLNKAVYLFTKSAELFNADAQYNLAVCYFNGEGVDRDISKALTLAKKAAGQGLTEAKNLLEKLQNDSL